MSKSRSPKRPIDSKKAATAFASAVAATTAMAPAVEAVIVPVVGTPVSFSATNSLINGTAFNVDGTGATADLRFFIYGAPSFAIVARDLAPGGRFVGTGGSTGTNPVFNLASSFTIGPTLASGSFIGGNADFFGSAGAPPGLFVPSNSGLVGFSFAGLSGVEYGWLRIHISRNAANAQVGLTILGGAYENTGAPIRAGATAVPEPSSLALGSLGLLALGAAGVRNYRRRKQEE